MMLGRRMILLGLSGLAAGLTSRADVPVYAVRMQSGLGKPVFVTSAPGDDSRLFVVEQGTGGSARVRVLNLATNTFAPNPLITVTGLATGSVGSEQGLLGLAFDPDFATNGNFYLNYTATGGAFGQGLTKVVRYTSADRNTTSTSTAQLLLQIDQPQTNHNAGWMGFGKDGYLYVATGDGGNGNDVGTGHTPNMGNAQDLTSLLGKMLRIDPRTDDFPTDATRNYAIPKGGAGQPPKNPFYNDPTHPTARPEIWNYGLRNPWRNSFDRKTGDLYIGDVGQSAREEIDFQPANSPGGLNFGWRIKEGTIDGPGINDPGHAPLSSLTGPIFDYDHTNANGGIAVTGGYVYRGNENPALNGTYFFADYGAAKIWTTKYSGTGPASVTLIQNPQAATPLRIFTPNGATIDSVSSFGEDNQGRLYITELGANDTSGELFRLIPAMPGDANGDRTVNTADFKILLANYAPDITGKKWAQGDFNDDHMVDFADFQILELNFGKSLPLADVAIPSAVVPEPTTLTTIAAGAMLLLTRRRRETA